MRPASAPRLASTARQLPSPAAVTNRKAVSSSTIVWRGIPQSKCCPNPLARLWKPAATAARCSASSRDKPDDAPIASPSLDKITTLSTLATLVTRSSSSQSKLPPVFIALLLLRSAARLSRLLVVGLVGHLLSHRASALPASLQGRHETAGRLRGGLGAGGLLGGHVGSRDVLLRQRSRFLFAQLRRKIGLPDSDRQAFEFDRARLARHRPEAIRVGEILTERQASCPRRPPGQRSAIGSRVVVLGAVRAIAPVVRS